MKANFKYDPEDLESLLTHKQFHELYPEEKEFVLRHIENETEYESLRKTLFELKDMSQNDEWLEPDPSIKKALMQEFAQERKGRFTIWLNSLFAAPDLPWFRQRGFAYSLAMACTVGLAVFFITKETKQNEFAELSPKESNALKQDLSNGNAETPADSLTVYPPAPAPLVETIQFEAVSADEEVALEPAHQEMKYIAQASDASVAPAESNEEIAVAPPAEAKDMSSGMSSNTWTQDVTISATSPVACCSGSTMTIVTSQNANSSYTFSITSEAIAASEMKDVLELLYTAK